jgi:hypothetical protein
MSIGQNNPLAAEREGSTPKLRALDMMSQFHTPLITEVK